MKLDLTKIYFPQFEKIDIGVVTTSISVRDPITTETYNLFINELAQNMPELTEIKKRDSKSISYRNKEVASDKQIVVSILNQNVVTFGWGKSVPKEMVVNHLEKFLEITEKTFKLNKLQIGYIDFAVFFTLAYKGNHYKLINDVFFNNSILSKNWDTNSLIENDIKLRSYIDKERLCTIIVEGTTSELEVLNNEFQEKSINITVGIAKVNFETLSKLDFEMLNHIYFASTFLHNSIEPGLFQLMENFVIK